jgi:cell division protein FtsB
MFEEIQAIRKNIDNKQEHFFDELYESQQDIPFDVEQAQKRLIQLQQDTQSLIKQIETLNKQK